ncbi:hypothetical protein JCM11491_005253 [Sporobolomyces phaffii]
MPHFSLALMKGTEQQHYRTNSEIHARTGKVRWSSHRTFSLVAQLLSPLSTLFSIPALSEHWYIRKAQDGSIVESRPDPALIIASGSILLGLSVLANASILLRLVDVHCRLFTFTTLAFLATHIILALVTVTIFAVQHAIPDGYTLSTAFWLTVASSAIALCVAGSLMIDGFRTRWYSRGGTGLTGEQRSLVIVFCIFVVNMIVGAAAYRFLLQDATFIDSTYFTVQSFITVGFGDVLPESAGARAFTIVFLMFGIINFAIFLAFIRSTALEAVKERYKARERRTLERIKTRHSAIVDHHSRREAFWIYVTLGLYHPKHDDVRLASRTLSEPPPPPQKETRSERKRHKRYAYEEKIEELNREQRLEFRSQLVIATIGVILVWLLGALVFMRLEGWTYWISFYFCFIAMSTLGLGDFSPASQGGRAFFCIWSLIGAGILTVFFSVIADEYSAHYKETFQRNLLSTFQRGKHKPGHGHGHGHRGHDKHGSNPAPQKPMPSPRSDTISTHLSDRTDVKSAKGVIREQDDESTRRNELDGAVRDEDEEDVAPASARRRRDGSGRKDRVNDLLSETRMHLQHLATRDTSDTAIVDDVVRRVMDEEEFAIRNRELVEQDKGLKEFIFLRNLLSVFGELEVLTNELLDESSLAAPAPERGGPIVPDVDQKSPHVPPRVLQYRTDVDEAKLKAG